MVRRPLARDPIAQAEQHWADAGWSDAAEGMAVVTSVMRAQQILLGRVDAVLASFRLTFARYEVLMLLHFSSRGSLPLGKVGERLQVHPASVTNAIDRLEAAGLVRRKSHPDDGRRTLAEVTAKGRRVALDATRQLNVEVFSDPAVTSEGRAVVHALRALRLRAGDFAADDPSG